MDKNDGASPSSKSPLSPRTTSLLKRPIPFLSRLDQLDGWQGKVVYGSAAGAVFLLIAAYFMDPSDDRTGFAVVGSALAAAAVIGVFVLTRSRRTRSCDTVVMHVSTLSEEVAPCRRRHPGCYCLWCFLGGQIVARRDRHEQAEAFSR